MTNRDTQTNLALARMIGKRAKIIGTCDGSECVTLHPHFARYYKFDAIHDGAAFDAVLEYVHENWEENCVERALAEVYGRNVKVFKARGFSWTQVRRFVCEAIVEASNCKPVQVQAPPGPQA